LGLPASRSACGTPAQGPKQANRGVSLIVVDLSGTIRHAERRLSLAVLTAATTGPTQLGHAARDWQKQLDQRLATGDPSLDDWTRTIARLIPTPGKDAFILGLADRLVRLTHDGYDAQRLLREAVDLGPLPDEHPTMAIWWRILDHLPHNTALTTSHYQSDQEHLYQVASRQARSVLLDRLRPPPPPPGPSR
jgi:hypothetical protein